MCQAGLAVRGCKKGERGDMKQIMADRARKEGRAAISGGRRREDPPGVGKEDEGSMADKKGCSHMHT